MGLVGCTDKDRDSNGNLAGILETITLQPDPLRLAVGGTATLTAQGTYRDGTTKDISKSVTWDSGDKTIASVAGGEVTGVAEGETTVIASYKGRSAQAAVQVTPAEPELVSLRVKSAAEMVDKLGTVQLEAEAVYSDGSARAVPDDLDIEWNSDNEKVAAVDNSGLVTGGEYGNANIAVQSADGKYACSRTCKVSVYPEEGDIITFGKWYDKDGALNEAITWKVMKVEAASADTPKRALLVAEKALDSQKYHPDLVDMNWKECSLRRWLTGSDAQGTDSVFYSTAFTAAEKAKIESTEHTTCDWGGTGIYGDATKDLVFLLDEAEVKSLFPSNAERKCACTEYAESQGASVSGGHCYWWLRSPGNGTSNAAYVDCVGDFEYCYIDYADIAVRPALYIAL